MCPSPLTQADYQGLERSWIPRKIAEDAGLCRVDSPEGAHIVGRNGAGDYSGILFPYTWPGIEGVRENQLRRDHPELEQKPGGSTKEKTKYIFPPGRSNILYIPPGITREMLTDVSLPIIVTEGAKKALALWRLATEGQEQLRFLPIAVSGVWSWRGTIGREAGRDGHRQPVKGPIADLARIVWQDRSAYILFDSDKKRNPSIQAAERELAKELASRGAIVRLVDLPDVPGLDKTGADDYLAHADGGPARMLELIDAAREFEPDLLRYPFNDAGNGERIMALFGPEIRYCHATKKWLYWTGTHWAIDTTGHLQKYAKLTITEFHRQAVNLKDESAEAFARRSLDARRIDNALYLLQCELPILIEELDREPHLLNFANGTVDLRSGELLPHRPTDYVTKCIAYDYNPEAKCPQFLAFLWRIMGLESNEERAGRLIHFLQTAIGYSLIAITIEKIVLICWGIGDNGKSTLLELLRILFSDYAATINVDSLMAKQVGNNELADLADLRGARFVRSSETEQGQRFNEARLKRITQGMGIIRTCRKYENMIEFPETHTLWIDANHKPVIRGQDNAIWNRLALVPFEVTIPKSEQDQNLGTKLLEEAEGILAWAVAGAVRWHSEGLQRPPEVNEAVATWRAESDPLTDFIEERCELGPDAWILSGILWRHYEEWTESSGVDALSRTQFNARLRGLGCRPDRRKVDGKARRSIEGITFRVNG